MKQPGVVNPEDLSARQQAEAAQFGKGGVDIFRVAVNGVYCAAISTQSLNNTLCRLLAEIPVAKKEINRPGLSGFDLLDKSCYFISIIYRHEGERFKVYGVRYTVYGLGSEKRGLVAS